MWKHATRLSKHARILMQKYVEEEIHFMCVNCAHHTVDIQCEVVERRIVVIAAESYEK